jgi:hypothetical protein
LNGAYVAADTPRARLAVAFRSCLELYYHLHPTHRYQGFPPDYQFIEDYMKNFVNLELNIARLEEHRGKGDARCEELAADIRENHREISRQLNIPETK